MILKQTHKKHIVFPVSGKSSSIHFIKNLINDIHTFLDLNQELKLTKMINVI